MALFSGSSGQRTALMQQAAAQQAQQAAAAQIAQGQELSLLQLRAAQPQQIGAIQQGQDQALAALKASKDAAAGYYNQATPLFDKYRDTGLDALSSYRNAVGLNGSAGIDAAKAAYADYTRPQIEMATDEAQRSAGAIGELYSGNTLAAVSDRAQKISSGGLGDYLNRLSYLNDQGYNATGAQAGLYQGLAGNETGYGAGAAGLYDKAGSDKAGIIGGTAANAAGVYSNAAAAQAQGLANLGKQQIDAYGLAQASRDRADTNALNLGIAGLNAAGTAGGAYLGLKK